MLRYVELVLCCTACVLSSWRPFRCHFQRCKDIWKRWRSQTSHDFGHLRTTSTSVWPFGSICPILSIVSILFDSLVPPWAIPMFATTFQSLQSSFFLPSSPFNILNHFSTSFSAVQELRAELQTLEQGVGSNDGEAELDGSGWIWAKDWMLPLHIAALGISWCIYA